MESHFWPAKELARCSQNFRATRRLSTTCLSEEVMRKRMHETKGSRSTKASNGWRHFAAAIANSSGLKKTPTVTEHTATSEAKALRKARAIKSA